MRRNLKLTIPEKLVQNDKPKHERKTKVVLIGIDGLNYSKIKSLVREGKLPIFERMIDDGAFGELVPPHFYDSCCSWSSIMTGTNLGKHGIFAYEMFDEKSFEFVMPDARARAYKPIWRVLEEKGKKIVVFNVPFSYPPDIKKGIMITDFSSPDGFSYSHPEYLAGELNSFGYSPKLADERPDSYYWHNFDQICEITRYLMGKVDWDCLISIFVFTDAYQAAWALNNEKVEALYVKMDNLLGQILTATGNNTTVFLCSDHGIGCFEYDLLLIKWLHDEGYMRLKRTEDLKKLENQKKRDENSLRRKADIQRRKQAGSKLKYTVSQLLRGYSFLKRRFDIPSVPFLKFPKWAIVPKPKVVKYNPWDWKNSLAFTSEMYRIGSVAGIIINRQRLKDRNLDYDVFRQDLREKLKKIRNPLNGESIIEEVWCREDIFYGEMLERMPDLLIRCKRQYRTVFPPEVKDVLDGSLVEQKLSKIKGSHIEDGFCIVLGKNIKGGARIKAPNIDIAPTLFYSLGLAVPSYMDGKVMDEIFTEDYLQEHPIVIEEMEGCLFTHTDIAGFLSQERLEKLYAEYRKLGYIK